MDLVLGMLSPPEQRDVLAHIDGCAPCRREREELTAALDELPCALAPAEPPGALWGRMGASIDHLERFSSFAPRLSALLALPEHDARRALHAYERPEEMPPAARPGMRSVPILPGPGSACVAAMLACFDPGCLVAEHLHDQEEHVLVFQGAFETSSGVRVGPGEELVSPAGTWHSLRILDGDPCLCAILKIDRRKPG
jgi:anti-sigma factor ChrR (cupin superfamily)